MLDELVKLYTANTRLTHAKSTLQREHYVFKYLADYFRERPLTKDNLITYVLDEIGGGDVNKYTHWRTIRAMLRWAGRNGYLPADPTIDLRFRFKQPEQVIPPTHDDVIRILEVIPKSTWRGKRDYALFSMVYFCGLRISEALSTTKDKIDLDGRQLIVRGKGDKIRMVPIPKEMVRRLCGWLGHSQVDFVFPVSGGKNKPISYVCANHFWGRYKKLAGYTRRCRLHDLRHAYAQRLYDDGTDISVIQRLLGHSNTNTTMRYAKLSTRRNQADVDRVFGK